MSIISKSHPGKIGAAARSHQPPEQIGAFCYRLTGDDITFLLITSSNGRWILPKGWPIPGATSRKVAQTEAWEEAGVRASDTSKEPILRFTNTKQTRKKGTFLTQVAVHTLAVHETSDTYPEAASRKRRWVTLDQAQVLICDDALRDAVADLVAHVTDRGVIPAN